MRGMLYLKIDRNNQVSHADVRLGDVAKLECVDASVKNRLKTMKLLKIQAQKSDRYVFSVMKVIEQIHEIYPELEIQNLGETDFIIDFQKPRPPRYLSAWLKTAAVCLISFFGAAFAIMTFNNDVSVTDAFDQIYLLVTGTSSDGFTILEISYSIGLGLGIVVFFNHFAHWKITTDPTPLEVEMRLYEENVCKTLIQNAGRKESGVDVS